MRPGVLAVLGVRLSQRDQLNGAKWQASRASSPWYRLRPSAAVALSSAHTSPPSAVTYSAGWVACCGAPRTGSLADHVRPCSLSRMVARIFCSTGMSRSAGMVSGASGVGHR